MKASASAPQVPPFTAENEKPVAIGSDEIILRIAAVGLHHTDLAVPPNPEGYLAIMAHEAAGVVEQVGNRVSKVRPKDHVVLTRLSCGQCIPCQKGYPSHCLKIFGADFSDNRFGGADFSKSFKKEIWGNDCGKSSLSTYALVTESNVVKVRSDAPLELLGPLGYSILTGAGAVFNGLHVIVGSSIAVFGLGAVGLSAVMAAVVSGCASIIGVDIRPERLTLAKALGATHTIDARKHDPVEVIKKISGSGVNYSIESTAHPSLLHQAVECLGPAGICGPVGCSPPGTQVSLDMNSISSGRNICGITDECSIADTFIPKLVDLYMQGVFPIDRLITVYEPRQIDRAIKDMAEGRVVDPVLRLQ